VVMAVERESEGHVCASVRACVRNEWGRAAAAGHLPGWLK
jgi:hypothetical protein